MGTKKTNLITGPLLATAARTTPTPHVMSRLMSWVMRIWMITARGAKLRITATSGSPAHPSRVGLPITTAIGTISSLGDTRGWMMSPGDLHHSTTVGGFPIKAHGAGYQRLRGLKASFTYVLSTRPRLWLG